jgi:hypothetical protein
MNTDLNHFKVRKPIEALSLRMVFLLPVSILVFIASLPIWGSPTASWILSFCFLLPVPLFAHNIISYALWKVEIYNQEIRYRSLLRTKVITFDSITRATLNDNLTLYFHEKELLVMSKSCRGYHDFVARLTQERIKINPVAIPGRIEDPEKLSQMESKFKRVLYWIIFICVAIIALVVVISRTH